MQSQIKRYNVVIHGRVQDIGFRDMVAQMANFLRLRGYVFNDVDGSVKVIVEGIENTLESFLDDIINKTQSIGAEITGMDRREVSRDIDLPPRFVKIPTTELEEIGRKLDVGVEILRSMDKKLDELDKLKKLDELDKLGNLNKFDFLIHGQDRMRETQEKMLKVLERIEEKL